MTQPEITAISIILSEYERAESAYKPYNSAHEGISFLKEEVDELWEEVKKKPQEYDMAAMTTEAAQIGAVVLRFLIHVCLKKA